MNAEYPVSLLRNALKKEKKEFSVFDEVAKEYVSGLFEIRWKWGHFYLKGARLVYLFVFNLEFF